MRDIDLRLPNPPSDYEDALLEILHDRYSEELIWGDRRQRLQELFDAFRRF